MLHCENLVRFYSIMKRLLLALTLFSPALLVALGDIKPVDSSAPVLQYFEPVQIAPRPGHADAPNFTFDQRKPLFTIHSVRQLMVHPNGRGVTLVLNEADQRRYAELTRRFQGRLLICAGAGGVVSISKINSPVQNGVIEFSDASDTGQVAKYLRRRFGK
jgi:hypothetical protein